MTGSATQALGSVTVDEGIAVTVNVLSTSAGIDDVYSSQQLLLSAGSWVSRQWTRWNLNKQVCLRMTDKYLESDNVIAN